MNRLNPKLRSLPLLVGALFVANAQATEFNWSGFMTLAAGKTLSGSVQGKNETGIDCPCMISDFSQSGVIDSSWDFAADSKIGLQGNLQLSDQLSLTAQVVSRGARDWDLNLEWVYAGWQLGDNDLLQVGRKRLPLFYYSEQQDVSFTYPWVHLPPQTYGWEAVNYNGINWNHSFQAGDWSGLINTFAGSETRKDNDYMKIYNGIDSETDTKWRKILGAELLMNRDWFEGRLMLMKSDTQSRLISDNEDWSAPAEQMLFGASGLIDYQDWIVSAELFFSDRTESYGRDLAYTLTAGKRLDGWTWYLTHGLYQQKISADNPLELTDAADQEKHRLSSLVVRFDVSSSAAVKVQLDHWQDTSGEWFKQTYGDANAISLSYDRVF